MFYSLVLCGYIAFSVLILNAYFLRSYQQTSSGSGTYFPTIVLDAGHGGMDSGAVGIDNVLEKDINLSIALNLKDLFNISGFNVKMTREKDESIHNEDSGTIRSQKVSDLKNRLNIINFDPNNLLISVHQNKFEDSKYKGAQVFYYKNSEEGKRLAEDIQQALCDSLGSTRSAKSNSDYYVLRTTTIPSAIVECGFLSNSDEETKLNTADYQQKTAWAIYKGISDYFNAEK